MAACAYNMLESPLELCHLGSAKCSTVCVCFVPVAPFKTMRAFMLEEGKCRFDVLRKLYVGVRCEQREQCCQCNRLISADKLDYLYGVNLVAVIILHFLK